MKKDVTAVSYKAAAGDIGAMNELALMYHTGYGVPQDFDEAFSLYEKSAAAGNAYATNCLGSMCREARNYPKAVVLYERAANAGNLEAVNNLAGMYYEGFGVEQDLFQAAQYYRYAGQEGFLTSKTNLAMMYRDGYGVPRNLSAAAELLKEAAEGGDVCAMEYLADMTCIVRGRNMTSRYNRAADLYRKAAMGGNMPASVKLATMMKDNLLDEKDHVEVIRILVGTSNNGYRPAVALLAEFYYRGTEGVGIDLRKAAGLYKKTAEDGDMDAASIYGDMLRDGVGVRQNHAAAVQYYSLAVTGGQYEAFVKLGVLYEYGLGVRQDSLKALELFEKALSAVGSGKLGLEAVFTLGCMYESGKGILRDITKAEGLYRYAADCGSLEAARALEDLIQGIEYAAASMEKSSNEVTKIRGINSRQSLFDTASSIFSAEELMETAELISSADDEFGRELVLDVPPPLSYVSYSKVRMYVSIE